MEDSTALYLDSGDRYQDNEDRYKEKTTRDYTYIKIVLNYALNGYALKGGPIKKRDMMESLNSPTDFTSPASSRIQAVGWSHGTSSIKCGGF